MTKTLDQIFENINAIESSSKRGVAFEKLSKGYFLTQPAYLSKFKYVWLWNEFPYREQLGKVDTGIDLVAQSIDNPKNFIAIQCKYFNKERTRSLQKGQIDSFLSSFNTQFNTPNGRSQFSSGIIVSTVGLSKNAVDVVDKYQKPIQLISDNDFYDAHIDWEKLDQGIYGKPAQLKLKENETLTRFQDEAIGKVLQAFEKENETRGQLIMACGTGKTYTALKIAETLKKKHSTILFLCPSISLVNQTIFEWYHRTEKTLRIIPVCSDRTVSQEERKSEKDDDRLREYRYDIALSASTDTHTLLENIRSRKDDELVVLIATYQSIDKVIEVQQEGNLGIDIVFCDEAHRTTGTSIKKKGNKPSQVSLFQRVHYDTDMAQRIAQARLNIERELEEKESEKELIDKYSYEQEKQDLKDVEKEVSRSEERLKTLESLVDGTFLRADKRLYMTATPKIMKAKNKASEKDVAVASMDDESFYGKNLYTLPFATAIKNKLLTDYKLIVMTASLTELQGDINRVLERVERKQKTVLKREIQKVKKKRSLDDDAQYQHLSTQEKIALNKEIKTLQKKYQQAEKITGSFDQHELAGLLVSISAIAKRIKNTEGDNPNPETLKKCLQKVVVYSSNIPLSKKITEAYNLVQSEFINEYFSDDPSFHLKDVEARHVDGTQRSVERKNDLNWLKNDASDPATCRILSNVRCLTEGVDVPALDGIVYLSSKNSEVDIVQSVGRIMRKKEGKEYGYIIVPVVIDDSFLAGRDATIEDFKNGQKSYKKVWEVATALRAHDGSFETDLALGNPKRIVIESPSWPEGSKHPTAAVDQLTLLDSVRAFSKEIQDKFWAVSVSLAQDKDFFESWYQKLGYRIYTNYKIFRHAIMNRSSGNREIFKDYLAKLKNSLNENLNIPQGGYSDQEHAEEIRVEAIKKIAIHHTLKRVFDAFFGNKELIKRSQIAQQTEDLIDKLLTTDLVNSLTTTKREKRERAQALYSGQELDDIIQRINQEFEVLSEKEKRSYRADVGEVRTYADRHVHMIDSIKKIPQTKEGNRKRQDLIKEVYNKVHDAIDGIDFSKRQRKTKSQLGIVYTPIEIVDFMLQSTHDLIKKHFPEQHPQGFNEKGVKVLDPFTGTGSYITRLIESELIDDAVLEHKYKEDIYANECGLISYYIADINIENSYNDRMIKPLLIETATGRFREKLNRKSDKYRQAFEDFDHISFVDSFTIGEQGKDRQTFIEECFDSEAIEKQVHTNFQVIIGNPPYSRDKRAEYKVLNQKLSDTYGQFGKAMNGNTYVKAFRWATDKLEEGIIAYITPSSWLTENGGRGIRHHFEKEFDAVYVYDLKGAYSGAHNVFGIGPNKPVAITFLIKKPTTRSVDGTMGLRPHQEKAHIYYTAIDENTKKKEKLDIIKNTRSITNLDPPKITPNSHDDWLDQRFDFPEHYIPVYAKKGGITTEEGHFFRTYSKGYLTGNDAHLVNFSRKELEKQVETLLDTPPIIKNIEH